MAGLGNTYKNNVLDAILGQGFTKPATVYIALYSATPTSAGGGTQITGSGYSRVAVPNNATNWPNAVGGSKSNGISITFPEATSNYSAPVTHFGVHDHITNDSLIGFGALGTPKTVLLGESPQFSAGQLVVTAV